MCCSCSCLSLISRCHLVACTEGTKLASRQLSKAEKASCLGRWLSRSDGRDRSNARSTSSQGDGGDSLPGPVGVDWTGMMGHSHLAGMGALGRELRSSRGESMGTPGLSRSAFSSWPSSHSHITGHSQFTSSRRSRSCLKYRSRRRCRAASTVLCATSPRSIRMSAARTFPRVSSGISNICNREMRGNLVRPWHWCLDVAGSLWFPTGRDVEKRKGQVAFRGRPRPRCVGDGRMVPPERARVDLLPMLGLPRVFRVPSVEETRRAASPGSARVGLLPLLDHLGASRVSSEPSRP